MSDLRRRIESLPPGIILIHGRTEVTAFIDALSRPVLRDLHSMGYRFFVVPEGVTVEALPDDVIEKMWLERQAIRKKMAATGSSVH